MRHRGWTYSWNDDHSDDDCRKIEHVATYVNGREEILDLSPYLNSPMMVTFEAMVELDFPSRSAVGSMGPLREEQVLDLYIKQLKKRYKIDETISQKARRKFNWFRHGR